MGTAKTTSVRLAQPPDCDALARMRAALWPESSAEEHARELAQILSGKPLGILPLGEFVSEAGDGTLIGFIEVSLRSYAEGCDPTRPVGYVEGWYVVESHRRKGVGADLLRAAENWARSQGCLEMASDAAIDNLASQRAQEALGFEVVERSVNFRKRL